MAKKTDHLELGQFIPMQYHHNMLNDTVRMQGFKEAINRVVRPGAKVLELGGGTGVLSFFAAQNASKVWCVERNPEMVATARRTLAQNANGDKVEVIQADASQYLPPEPVDVVVCEMLHVGMLREKQLEIIHGFKQRYLEKFGGPLPIFVPEASLQAVQLIQQDFTFEGYYAPVILFQDPNGIHEKSVGLSDPSVFQMFAYDEAIPQVCSWDGVIEIEEDGELNALRMITKNLLAILLDQGGRTVDWHNQYMIVPLAKPIQVSAGDQISIKFCYEGGAPLEALTDSLEVSKVAGGVDKQAVA